VQSKTASHVDQTGFDVAVKEVKTVAAGKPVQPTDAPGIFNRFVQGMIEHGPQIYEKGKQLLGVMNLEPSSVLRTALSAIQSQSRRIEPLLGM